MSVCIHLHGLVRRLNHVNPFVDLITRSLYTTWPDAGTLAVRDSNAVVGYAMEKQFRKVCDNDPTEILSSRRPLDNSQNCEEKYKAQDLGMALHTFAKL